MGSLSGILLRPVLVWNPSLLHCRNMTPTSSCCTNKVNNLGVSFFNCVHTKSVHTQSSLLSDSLSQSEDGEEPPQERISSVAGGIVALGKFEALHIGHRELAIQAAKIGVPFLLSFVGMAEVLGWEHRVPIVAKCDRKRVLSCWAPYCGGMIPREFQIEFSNVRYLSPRHFIEKLSKDLGVHGVVAGENYRFGYKASGGASDLLSLCNEYGIQACIINSVMDKYQDPKSLLHSFDFDAKERGQVSSTQVRCALAEGDMNYVSALLGRHHRLFLTVGDQEWFSSYRRCRLSAPKSCLLNLPPKEGVYEKCSIMIDDENVVACRVIIDTSHIHLDLDWDKAATTFQELNLVGIDIRGSGIS